MLTLRSIVKLVVLPPFLNLFLGLVGLLILTRYPRSGRCLIAISLLSIYFMSTGLFSGGVSYLGDKYDPLVKTDASRCEAIVVLGGGVKEYAPEYGGQTSGVSSLIRVRYGARLAKELDLPILVTGGVGYSSDEASPSIGDLMAVSLRDEYQMPPKWVESKSRNTYENGTLSKQILAAEGINNIVLVTQSFHMRRSVEVFSSLGFNVVPAPTDFRGYLYSPLSIRSYIPKIDNFQMSASVMSEVMGRIWYGLQRGEVGQWGKIGRCV